MDGVFNCCQYFEDGVKFLEVIAKEGFAPSFRICANQGNSERIIVVDLALGSVRALEL